jgi:hypothetical protein
MLAGLMSIRNRLLLALRTLKGSNWEHFERLCSAFLAVEFPLFRTTGSPGGDRGRDAELFNYSGSPSVLFQFSVQRDWKQKIADTLKRVTTEFPEATHIVFMSCQEIGAQGDDARGKAIALGLSIDIRDQSWFTERVNLDDSRRAAAEELARVIVDPLLHNSGVLSNAPGLTGQEAKTALVYLEMQARDEVVGKGLTKSCFEALVKCSLRGTSAQNRKSRKQVQGDILSLLPQHSAVQLNPLIDVALKRLTKGAIKHWTKTDDFHLSFEELEGTKDRVVSLALLNQAFTDDVVDILRSDSNIKETNFDIIAETVRHIIEVYFFRLGEEFALCLVGKQAIPLHEELLRDITIENAPTGRPYAGLTWNSLLERLVIEILRTPSEATTELLRLLSTSYTLFAFLSEVPDVQKATKKLFEHGTIWLDTSAVLPLFAEQAFPEDMRPFTDLMVQLGRAGTKLAVSEGVIEEIESHLNLCVTYLRTRDWQGRVPYVYARFRIAGKSAASFPSWVDNIFMGKHRPMDDLAEFLRELAKIEVEKPPYLDNIDDDVVNAIREYWKSVQDKRRRGDDRFNINANRLAEHDSENYLSALAQRRGQPGGSALGYSSWLLTLDSAAWSLLSAMDDEIRRKVVHAPVISLDFLLKYLAFGPRRDRIDTSGNGSARIFTASIYESIPVDLINVADIVRARNAGVPERLIQRRIRDELDKQKMAAGAAQQAGLEGAESAFKASF